MDSSHHSHSNHHFAFRGCFPHVHTHVETDVASTGSARSLTAARALLGTDPLQDFVMEWHGQQKGGEARGPHVFESSFGHFLVREVDINNRNVRYQVSSTVNACTFMNALSLFGPLSCFPVVCIVSHGQTS